MKKIVITGATSMIGVATVEAAVSHGVEVYAVIREKTSRRDRLPSSPLVHTVYGTLESILAIDELPHDCDAFYHFAWGGTGKAERDNPEVQALNIRYTLDAVELASICGCKKFIGAGSQAEYGPTREAINDETRFAPVSSYGMAKLAAGLLGRKKCDRLGMIHIWGRIFSVYGPHDNEGTMLKYAINQFAKREEAHFSAATQMWNYLYESDAGEMFFLLGQRVDKSSEYRIAHHESRTLREYIHEVSEMMNADKLCVFASPDNQDIYGIDTVDEKLFRAIHYRPKVDFRVGIRLMADSITDSTGDRKKISCSEKKV